MFANFFDSDSEKKTLETVGGLALLFLILRWLKSLTGSTSPALKNAAEKSAVTIIETVAKRITGP
jgi:hypothetical protein